MSSHGQGSIGYSQKNAPSGAGNSIARNGLSVDGAGNVVLGNDVGASLAALISNREVPLDGFTMSFKEGAKESTFYPASVGAGTNIFCSDDIDGQVAAINGHNVSSGINAFVSLSAFSDINNSAQLLVTNSNYAFPGGFPQSASAVYASGVTPKLYLLTDNGGQIIFCPGGITAADNTMTLFQSGNIRMGAGTTDPGVNLQLDGQIATGDAGFTGGPGKWNMGSLVVGASVLDATRFVEIAINGTLLKLALAV